MKSRQDIREVLCKRTCFDKAVPSEQALPHLEQLDRIPRPNKILILVCHVPWRLCKESIHLVRCHTLDICALSASSLLVNGIAGEPSHLRKIRP